MSSNLQYKYFYKTVKNLLKNYQRDDILFRTNSSLGHPNKEIESITTIDRKQQGAEKLTLEVNTPSHEQCVVSHLERNMSRDLLEKIRNSNENLSGIEIPAIDYLDPFDNRKEW